MSSCVASSKSFLPELQVEVYPSLGENNHEKSIVSMKLLLFSSNTVEFLLVKHINVIAFYNLLLCIKGERF